MGLELLNSILNFDNRISIINCALERWQVMNTQ